MLCLFLLCFVIDFIWCNDKYIDLSQLDYFVTEQFDKVYIRFNTRSLSLKIDNKIYVNNSLIQCQINETKTYQITISKGTRSILVKYKIPCLTKENSKNLNFITKIFTETRPKGIYVGWLHTNVDEISDHILVCTNSIGEQYQQNMKYNSFILIGVKENVSYQICVANVNRKSIISTFKCTLVQYKSGSSKILIKNENKMRIINRDNINEFSNNQLYKLIVKPNIKNFNLTLNSSIRKRRIYWEIIEDMQGSMFEFIVIFNNSKSECKNLIHFQCENCLFPLNETVLNKQDRKYRNHLLMCRNNFSKKFDWKNLAFQSFINYKNISENYTISIYGTNIFGVHTLYSSTVFSQHSEKFYNILVAAILIAVVSTLILILLIVKFGVWKSKIISSCIKVNTSSSQLKPYEIVTYRNSDGKKYNEEEVSILKFEKYYENLIKNGQAELNKKFYKLKKESREQESSLKLTTNDGGDSSNISKNRFQNILPYDENRVKVGINGLPDDYINASYIKSDYNEQKIEYIASQAPNDDTVSTFWQMMWEQNINFIVMLTQLEEGSHHKCLLYWPNTIGEKLYFGDNSQFYVVLVETIDNTEYTERKLILSYNDCQHRKVVQLHMNTWFDYSAPNLENFDRFLFRFHELTNNNHEGPYLVHCSAGVGRTGTFICLDKIIKDLINGEQQINIYATILRLRRFRLFMVQRKTQFRFVHDYINHFLKTYMIFNKNDEAIYCNQTQF